MPNGGTVSFIILNNILLFAHSHGVFLCKFYQGKKRGEWGGEFKAK